MFPFYGYVFGGNHFGYTLHFAIAMVKYTVYYAFCDSCGKIYIFVVSARYE
jgi:hypothetical protein